MTHFPRSRAPSTSPTVPVGIAVLAAGVASPEERPPEPRRDRRDSLVRDLIALGLLLTLGLVIGLGLRAFVAVFP